MKKKILVATAAAMSMAMSVTALAGVTEGGTKGSWQQNETGWWWQNEDGSWANTGWYWIDGNDDGVAECYFFDGNGYMMANSVSGDGFHVNADGAWVVDGVVQTRNLNEAKTPEQSQQAAAGELNKDNGGYNEWGASNAAIEMMRNSREENTKFGEVSVLQQVDDVYVVYKNGFGVVYPNGMNNPNYDGATYKTVQVDRSRTDLDGSYLFKYYEKDVWGEEAAKKLHRVGFYDGATGNYAYASGNTCRACVTPEGDVNISWMPETIKGRGAHIHLR